MTDDATHPDPNRRTFLKQTAGLAVLAALPALPAPAATRDALRAPEVTRAHWPALLQFAGGELAARGLVVSCQDRDNPRSIITIELERVAGQQAAFHAFCRAYADVTRWSTNALRIMTTAGPLQFRNLMLTALGAVVAARPLVVIDRLVLEAGSLEFEELT